MDRVLITLAAAMALVVLSPQSVRAQAGIAFPDTPVQTTSRAAVVECPGTCFSSKGQVTNLTTPPEPFAVLELRITEFGSTCEGSTTSGTGTIEAGQCLKFVPIFTPQEVGVFSGSITMDWVIFGPPDSHLTFTWTLTGRGVGTLSVTDVGFKHPEFPTGQLADALGGSVDGNLVTIEATIANPEPVEISETVYFEICADPTDEVCGPLPGASAISRTFPPVDSVVVAYEWDTEGWAWWGWTGSGRATSERFIRVRVQDSRLIRTLNLAPKPVVLVHGLWSSSATWDEYRTFLNSAHPAWTSLAAYLDTGTPGRPGSPLSIAMNARNLAEQVDRFRDQHEAWHIDIVAHSLGGLISRNYIHSHMPATGLKGRPTAAHLLTLGTPHAGTPCAGLVPSRDVTELRYAAVTAFNARVTRRKGVSFSALAGNPRPRTCHAQFEGDSVVEAWSARFSVADNMTRDIVHTAMTGSREIFDDFVLPRLARGPTRQESASAAAGVPPPSEPTETSSPQLAHLERIDLPAGASIQVPIEVSAASGLGVILDAPMSLSVTFEDPEGTAVPESEAGLFRHFRATSPAAGTWTLSLANGGSQAVVFDVSAWLEGSPFELSLEVAEAPDRDLVFHLRATLLESGASVTAATVTAEVSGLDGSELALSLSDDGQHGDGGAGDGIYGVMDVGPLGTTAYGVVVRAEGVGFSRATTGTLVDDGRIFSDGFESGSPGRWSAAVSAPSQRAPGRRPPRQRSASRR